MTAKTGQDQFGQSAPVRVKRRLSGFEKVMILAMLAVLGVASLDAMDGRLVGANNTLEMAKAKGQQVLTAIRLNAAGPH